MTLIGTTADWWLGKGRIMYAQILVPLDGSKLAEDIVSTVDWLATATRATVKLFAVLDDEFIAALAGRFQIDRLADAKQLADDYLAAVGAKFSSPPARMVRTGMPAEAILVEAEETEDVLIAMSTHGRTGMRRWALGSVADKVLRATTRPLLLYRKRGDALASAGPAFTTVIVPLDGSKLAEEVLVDVLALAGPLRLSVVLVRVVLGLVALGVTYDIQLDKELERQAGRYVRTKAAQLRKAGVADVRWQVLRGHAANAIVDCLQATPDSFVAMTTHGRSGFGRWALGSVASKLVEHAGAPVLIRRSVPHQ